MFNPMELLVCIVNDKEGSQFLRLAQEKGLRGATLFLGEGTVGKGFLRKLGMDSTKKEIVMMIAPKSLAEESLEYIAQKKELHKKNKGIAFRLPLSQVLGVENSKIELREETKRMFQSIFVIVNRGEAEEVMDIAQDAGAKGGTVILGRGAGQYEIKKVFNMDIEPEKEIVLIISEKDETDSIVNALNAALKLDEPNTGILFVADLSDTRGIY